MASKSKSSLSATPKIKSSSVATPTVGKVIRRVTKSEPNSPSPLHTSPSPRAVKPKPPIERRSPKLTTTATPDKQPTGVAKGSELQAQLSLLQEDLKKAKEEINLIEKEKAQAIEKNIEARRLAEEVNDKLNEALEAKKRAEETSEIEKFRVIEERAGVEAGQKREEEWQKELEAVRSQHALDVDALLSATQELQKTKQELSMACDAKNQALSHADDATKLAEIHAEKLEILSAEVTRLKGLLDSKFDKDISESNQTVSKMKLEIDSLKQELYNTRNFDQKLLEREAATEQLNAELEAVKVAECYARDLVRELTIRVEELEGHVDESNKLERSASESLDSVMKQLEGSNQTASEMKLEIVSLKQKLDKARNLEEKLVEGDAAIEQLNVELEAAKLAESYAHNLVKELKIRVEELEIHVDESNKLERSASESLDSVMKQLEGSNDLLHDAESEIYVLKEKIGLLEITIRRQKKDLEKAEHCLVMAKEETSEITKTTELLKYELETVKEEKAQALNNEKLAAVSVQSLLEERNKLMNELENLRDEEEKSKKAMESLASALHEVSAEGRETKEKLLSSQAEYQYYETQIEDLKLVLKATNEKYEILLENAKHEVDLLMNTIEQSKREFLNSKAGWEHKERHLVNCVKQSEEKNSSMEKEVNRLVCLLKEAKEEVCATKEEESHLKDSLKEVEDEVIYLQRALSEAEAKSMKLKERCLDKETELQDIIEENEELRSRGVTYLKKVDELSKLLEEAMAIKETEENVELTDSEKDYDLLPTVIRFSEENGHGGEDKPKTLLHKFKEAREEKHQGENKVFNNDTAQLGNTTFENVDRKSKENGMTEKPESVEPEFLMWESWKIEKKEYSPDREPEQESFDGEVDSKVSTENLEGGNIPISKHQEHKKKKHLLGKFGDLLKKKGTSNQK